MRSDQLAVRYPRKFMPIERDAAVILSGASAFTM